MADVRGGETERALRVREEAVNYIRIWRRKCVERLLRKYDFLFVCLLCVYDRSRKTIGHEY